MRRAAAGPRPLPATVELTVRARAENLALVRLALAGVAASARAPREVVADLKLAVTEACTNAIQYAYAGSGGNDEIVVRYTVGNGRLSVEVEDWGRGFDPSIPQPPADGQSHGMGLMIIGVLSDELGIASTGSGTRIAFARRFGAEG